MNGGWGISHEIAPRWIPLDLTDDKSTLVQVMAWCHQATSHYLSQCWSRSMSPNGVTRPHWVKQNLCYTFEDEASVDFIYRCRIFKWVAKTWLHNRVPGEMAAWSHAPSKKQNIWIWFPQQNDMSIKIFLLSCNYLHVILLTIFRFGHKNAWHSMVSLSVFRAIYANTLSWLRSAVQKQILKKK